MSAVQALSKPYHLPLTIDSQAVLLDHLEPFQMKVDVERLSRSLLVDVRFSNHCFTEAFDPARHPVSWRVMDGRRERAFCWERYNLSPRLPGMVQALPGTAVWLTRREHNYVYFILIDDGADHYPMFFNLRRGSGCDLSMFVESAYIVDQLKMKEILASSTKVRFPILCAKVYQGEKVRSHTRR